MGARMARAGASCPGGVHAAGANDAGSEHNEHWCRPNPEGRQDRGSRANAKPHSHSDPEADDARDGSPRR